MEVSRFCPNDMVEMSSREREISSVMLPGSLSVPSVRLNYIEHRVSKMDTLAGVAIKYGVEVADIKRMNGLVTDLQMFALKSLQIPLPGRHLPSPTVANGSSSDGESSCEQITQTCRPHIDVLESFQPLKLKPPRRKVSSAMSKLQGYYGLTPPRNRGPDDGTEVSIYQKGLSLNLDAEQLLRASPVSDAPLTRHRKSRSLVNEFLPENGESFEDLLASVAGDCDVDSRNDLSNGRHQNSFTGPTSPTPVLILKDDNTSGGFSGITGKGLALRPKSGSRFGQAADAESGMLSRNPNGDSNLVTDVFAGVRKSSSTSNLQASDNGSSAIWPTSRYSSKLDLQAISNGSTTRRPIFDGLPKPITSWRIKAARD